MSRYIDPSEESAIVEAKANPLPATVNGMMKYIVLDVGDGYIDVWDERTKNEWGAPSFTRLMMDLKPSDMPYQSGFQIGQYVHIQVTKLTEVRE
jgi:hypothetical protein